MSAEADAIPPRAFPNVTVLESLRFILTAQLPPLVIGATAPHPRMAALVGKAGVADRAAALYRSLRARHGEIVWVRGLTGPVLLVLGGDELERFFSESVEVLALDAKDKVRGLGVVEPAGVNVSHGRLRTERRRLNDEALAAGRPHPDSGRFLDVVVQETRGILTAARVHDAELRYQQIEACFERVSRRCILGDRAAADDELTGWLLELRSAANWLGMRRGVSRRADRTYLKLSQRIRDYAATAGPDTLVGRIAAVPTTPQADPLGQVHHWFMSIDGLAPVAARTLLALAAHPGEQDAVRIELDAGAEPVRLRACVQESLRLWPPVPALLRVTRREMHWHGVPLPIGTRVLAPMDFHQRDPSHVPGADRFVPERWLADYGTAATEPRLSPFGRGPGGCPGSDLALQLATAFCTEALRVDRLVPDRPLLNTSTGLPRGVDCPSIRLGLAPVRVRRTDSAPTGGQ